MYPLPGLLGERLCPPAECGHRVTTLSAIQSVAQCLGGLKRVCVPNCICALQSPLHYELSPTAYVFIAPTCPAIALLQRPPECYSSQKDSLHAWVLQSAPLGRLAREVSVPSASHATPFCFDLM
jgi:hypothetical protein